MTATISEEELRAAYAALAPAINDPGMTTEELGALWGVSQRTTQKRVRQCVQHGTLRAGRRTIKDTSGRSQQVPVYELVPQPKAKGKR